MPIIPLRKLVSAIGLTVAIAVTVATPSVYFIHDYFDASAQFDVQGPIERRASRAVHLYA